MDGFSLQEIGRSEIERYLAVYRLLGERWMWFSRLTKPRAEIEAILADPAVELYAVRFEGRDVGLLELDFRLPGEGELAFFGLDEPVLGKGAGRWLMNRALTLPGKAGASSLEGQAPAVARRVYLQNRQERGK